MVKRILSVLAGVAVAMVIIQCGELIGSKLYPPPSDIDFQHGEALKHLMAQMPMGAFLLLLLGYAVGSFAGGLTSALVSGRETSTPSLITGMIIMAGGALNLYQIPHPMWFNIANIFVYVLFAYLGFLVVSRKNENS